MAKAHSDCLRFALGNQGLLCDLAVAVGYHFGACTKNEQPSNQGTNWLIRLDWIGQNVQILGLSGQLASDSPTDTHLNETQFSCRDWLNE